MGVMTASNPIKCLDCSEPLGKYLDWNTTDQVECSCDVRYSLPLLNEVDRIKWEQCRTDRLFDRVGNELWISNPMKPQERYEPNHGKPYAQGYSVYVREHDNGYATADIDVNWFKP